MTCWRSTTQRQYAALMITSIADSSCNPIWTKSWQRAAIGTSCNMFGPSGGDRLARRWKTFMSRWCVCRMRLLIWTVSGIGRVFPIFLAEELILKIPFELSLLDFTTTADYWSFPFESPALELDLEDAWTEIKPLYELLHAYVRRRLREYYGPERISRQAPLPSHILGM